MQFFFQSCQVIGDFISYLKTVNAYIIFSIFRLFELGIRMRIFICNIRFLLLYNVTNFRKTKISFLNESNESILYQNLSTPWSNQL